MMYSHSMFMYDRKRSYHQAMEAFGMTAGMESTVYPAAYYTHHLQPPLKYPKIDTTYYPPYPTEDQERYQANITVSVQQPPQSTYNSTSYQYYNSYSQQQPVVATANGVNAMSPNRSATVDEQPLTPPLSVSPITSTQRSENPIARLERDNTIGYRSASSSPSGHCDSTTNSELLATKLPLHVLSDLSEGLPIPGM